MGKWIVLGMALCALVSAPVALGDLSPSPVTVYVQNASSAVSDAEVQDALPAFQAAVTEDFAPYWSDAHLVLGTGPPGSWQIFLQDDSDVPGALGYHDVSQGSPIGFVFVHTALLADVSWQLVFTHELFEILGDPYANRGIVVRKTVYVVETADPVEDENYSYTRPSATGQPVVISDFVFENWFRKHSAWPYDFTHAARRPLQVLPGGYQLCFRDGVIQRLIRGLPVRD
jgi:hypothetical protein